MSELTAAQRKWLAGVQKALNKPGGEGLRFATGGDPCIIVYSGEHDAAFLAHNGDPVDLLNDNDGWHLDDLNFPHNVEGWCV